MSQDTYPTTLRAPRVRERSSEDALPTGTVLGDRYRIDTFIGQGGFGIAYLAWHLPSSERVVIKEYLPRELARRSRSNVGVVVGQSEHRQIYEHGLESFLSEARLLQQFDEPSIVRVREIFQENETAYLVMPYEEGPTLAEMVKSRQRFEERDLRMIFLQLLDGLRVVHAAGYLHRDIKPSNIIIRSSDRRPILIDFGAARQALVERSRSISSMLTPGYAPFEQYPGYSKRQGRWSDLYSLGMTLYQAVTQCSEDKLEQSNSNVRLDALNTGAPDPLAPAVQAGAGFCSQDLLSTIDWLMRPRIEDRPQSVEEVQSCLIGGSPVPPASPRPTVTRPQASAADTLIAPKTKPPALPLREGRNGLGAVIGGLVTVVGVVALSAWLILPGLDKLPFLGNGGRGADMGGAGIRSDQASQATDREGVQGSAPPSVADTGVLPLAGANSESAIEVHHDTGSAGGNAASSPVDSASGTPAPASGGSHRYTLTVHPQPANAHVALLNGAPRYRPGMALEPKRYRLRITAPHYQSFEASLVLKSDVSASVKLCPYVAQGVAPPREVLLPRSPPHIAVQNLSDRINIPTSPEGGELVRRTEAMLCVRAQKDLNERLTARCQGLGGQGAASVSPCGCQPVSAYVHGRYVVTQSCGVTGTLACRTPREPIETTALPAPPPGPPGPARLVVDPSCPAPALAY